MRLVIAEKPMLARDIARAICGRAVGERETLPVSGNGWCVCALSGHVLRLAEPAEIDPRWAWGPEFTEAMLPIAAARWPKRPAEGKEDVVREVSELLGKCEMVVHAGDPDDEGQLLVDELLDYLGYEGPVWRVLVNDNIEESIRRAFEDLRPNEEFRGLSEAAYARQMADMCLGVSESRLAAMRLGKRLSVGRVQTPTLGLVVRRDEAVESHEPQHYWKVEASVDIGGAVVPFELARIAGDDGAEGRFGDEASAAAAARALEGAAIEIEVTVSRKRKAPPLPHTLTTLQAEMSKRHGLTLQQTMDATQVLRDKWKAISYNRSDCPYLPHEHHAAAPKVLLRAMGNLGERWELDFSVESRAFDDGKVGAHHGIIPQDAFVDASALTEAERNVYRAVVGRYAMQFSHPMLYDEAVSAAVCSLGTLRHTERRVVDSGFMGTFAGKAADEGEPGPLSRPGKISGTVAEAAPVRKETAPPKRYTEGTLASDMARAAKYVADPELKKVLLRKDEGKEGERGGIGTVATRARIIETLKERGFIATQGSSIVSTRLGREFYGLVPDDIKGADLTARWWLMQQEVAAGRADADCVQRSVAETVRAHVASGCYSGAVSIDDAPEVGRCPLCGAAIRYRGKVVACESNKRRKNEAGEWEDAGGCGFKVFSTFCGKTLTENQMRKLLEGRKVKVGGLAWKGQSGKSADLIFDRGTRRVSFAPGSAASAVRRAGSPGRLSGPPRCRRAR